MTDTGLILLERNIAGVVQAVLDVPVASDCGGGMARRYGGIGHIVGNLGGAAPEAGLGISMQDIAGDADNGLDQWFPLGPSDCGVGAEYFGSPGFVSAAPGGDLGVAAGGVAGSADGFDILQQGGLIILQLNDDASLRLRGGLEVFFGSAWRRA